MVDIAQLVSVPGCGPGGRGFESHYSPHFDTKLRTELYEFEFITNRMDSNGQKIKQSGELFGCPGVIVQTFAKSYESHKNVRLCSASRSAQVKRRESHYSPHFCYVTLKRVDIV